MRRQAEQREQGRIFEPGGVHGEDRHTTGGSERLVSLPLFYNLTDAEHAAVIDAVLGYFGARAPGMPGMPGIPGAGVR